MMLRTGIFHQKLVVPGMTVAELDTLNELVDQLARKRTINQTRRNYVEMRQDAHHLGIAVPPHLQDVEIALGWPRLSVYHLADRVNFEGLTLPGAELSEFGIDRLVRQNKLRLSVGMTQIEALKYGPAFFLITPGGTGYPDAIIRGVSPRAATVKWDSVRWRASAFLAIVHHNAGRITEFIYADEFSIISAKLIDDAWTGQRTQHAIGRCPVATLAYRPDLDNPMGRSRVSKDVMTITDGALRTMLRSEITAEFFSAPQRYLFGADESAFVDEEGNPVSGWSSLIGRWNAINKGDDDDQMPSIWQAPQTAMTPHIEMLRKDAGLMSGAANIPVGALGIVFENPASDSAMKTTYLAMDKDAESAISTFTDGVVDAVHMAVQMRDGLSDIPDELASLDAKYKPAATPTQAAAADSMSKEIGAIPWIGETEVALEGFGHSKEEIERLLAEKARIDSRKLLAAVAGPQPTSSGDVGAA